jgi:hypothetical protein
MMQVFLLTGFYSYGGVLINDLSDSEHSKNYRV